MSIKHFSHEHPLVLIQEQSHTSEKDHCSGSNEPVDQEQCHASEEACFYCSGCKDQVEGPSYCCTDCKFYLHKTCAEQAQEISHPFHRKHPLTLLAQSLNYKATCNFCRNPCKGFVYHCSSCKFYLHVKCFLLQQFLDGKFSEFQHFGHKHPLIFIEKHNNEVRNPCSACKEPLLGSIFGCFDCWFYLHEACVKLPREINDPFHRKHPLKLLVKSPYSSGICICDFCNRHCGGFVYHCSSCQFDLHVKCALHPIFSGGNIPEIKHFSHEHPLIFIEKHKSEVQDSCSWCEESLSGPIYSCFDCGFHLDKKCFELPLEINHPFHRRHPLVILDKPPNPAKDTCNFCRSRFRGFLYHCSCGFNLHIRCALLAQLNPDNVEEIRHFSHEAHPLIFIEKHSFEVNDSCLGCRKRLSGPIYSCLDCMFHLHKNCAELPVEINHPSHRKHPLVLWSNLPTHQKGCSCYLCKKQMQSKGFVYYCSDCKFGSMPEDVSLSRMTTPENHDHEHPFTLVSRPISFICDFCGNDGYGTPYLCPTCDLVVENGCISFPSTIRIIRHPHKISHIYFLPEKNKIEKRECSICRKNVNTEHGSYYCGDCNYIVHVHCATDEFIWDRTTDLDDEDQMSKGALRSSIVIKEIRDGEDLIASKIKHYFHEHVLRLTRSLDDGLNQDDRSCDGCMQPISAPFYSCGQKCDFFLHGNCAELPMEKRHPLHRHPLTLYKQNYISNCKACLRFHHGLSYRCKKCDFDIDIQCSLLSDTFKHESHEHQLFLDHKYEGNCSACLTHIAFRRGAFRCKYCEFVLDFKCITLPHKAWYKYDRHFLTLTYTDNSDPNQHYCDICEEERNPKHWFYYCKDCDNSIHPECVLGELPHIKLGRKYRVSVHPHPLVFVKKNWNLPLCKVCGSLCKVQFLECRSGCDFTIHWRCKGSFNDESEMQLPNYGSEMQSLFGDGRMGKS